VSDVVLFVAHHGVEDSEELARAGGDGEFGWFSCGFEAGSEGFEGGVVA
jgi:hypothetical protein